MTFTEARLEQAIIDLLATEGIPHTHGATLDRDPATVLIADDLRDYLAQHYATEQITANKIESVIRQLVSPPASDLYKSKKQIMKWVSDGFLLKREDRSQKDIYLQLIDYSESLADLVSHLPPHSLHLRQSVE
ncbi:MAG: hypothetical protein HQL48_05660 [Gammaproteobacteria bacterium]|nr:hypothetical protein [Gammaproteobacteria bacterium]